MVSLVLIIPSVIGGGYIPNYNVYSILRFINCTALPIMWISSSTYRIEVFGPKWRRAITAIGDFPLGYFIMILLVYLTRDYKLLHLWAGIVAALTLPALYFIPESPRWMAGIGRRSEAEKLFFAIAKGIHFKLISIGKITKYLLPPQKTERR